MKLKHWFVGAAGALALAAFGSGAQAGPLGGIGNAPVAGHANAVESVAWVTRCHRHRGHRHCRRVWRDYHYGYYNGYDYYGNPYAYGPYAYGGSYLYGPGFGFSFGGHHHHHHHHRHRRHRH